MTIDATHDPKLKSWEPTANRANADFPIQNLPHGVFRRAGEAPRGGVAIGLAVLDMRALVASGQLRDWAPEEYDAAEAAAEPTLNRLMALDPSRISALRARLQSLLVEGAAHQAAVAACLVPIDSVELLLPARIGAFTDYMTSAAHIVAERPARPRGTLPPCFWTLPIAYNSGASSMRASGRAVERPWGQYGTDHGAEFGVSRALDYELEFACYIGRGNALGEPIRLSDARRHIFGYSLLNDWSARDFQVWESVLGPFQAKVFRSTVSPWVITADAIAPFRIAMPMRPDDAPQAPRHLAGAAHDADSGLAIRLQAELLTDRMRREGTAPHILTDTVFGNGAWSFEQMITHHAIGGCDLNTGDVLSSGTLSGADLSSAACIAEITGGKVPIQLQNGEQRLWLQDGDEVTFRARAEREGYVGIGFGACAAVIAPPVAFEP